MSSLSWSPQPRFYICRFLVQVRDSDTPPFEVSIRLEGEFLTRCLKGKPRAVKQLGILFATKKGINQELNKWNMAFTLLGRRPVGRMQRP